MTEDKTPLAPLSVEELMVPRYKVIAEWPDMLERFSVGYIFEHPYGRQYLTESSKYDPADFPHLFQPLPWWAEREEWQMPEYVKVVSEDVAKRTGVFCKVTEWDKYPDNGEKWGNEGNYGAILDNYLPVYERRFGEKNLVHITHFIPVTKEEYEQSLTK